MAASELTPITGAGEERSLVPAVTRAASILRLLAAQQAPLGLSAIARALDLPKSSVANLCIALVDEDFLRSTSGGFELGPALAQLGAAYLAGIDHVKLFQEACQRLAVAREETAQLAMLSDGMDVTYLSRRDGRFPVRLASAPGRSLPASCTATGKAMLAALDPAELERRLKAAGTLVALTPNSITTRPALRKELAEIRARGFAVDHEEVIEGVVCVAAAVPADDQRLAVSFTLLRPRATEARIAELGRVVHDVAQDIARSGGQLLVARP